MTQLAEFMDVMDQFAPLELAEDWDNVGLLAGDPNRPIERIMTCLTITPASAAEAVDERADLIVAHHPLPFQPLKRITTETIVGKLLLDVLSAGIAIYSPHTAFDSAREGINQRLAEGLQLNQIAALIENASAPHLPGAGRYGALAKASTLGEMADRVKAFLGVQQLRVAGDPGASIGKAAVACGSGGSFLAAADQAGCQLLVTGETTFHGCLEAEARGVALILPGHFASERFALECLADFLSHKFSGLQIWASRREIDPLVWV